MYEEIHVFAINSESYELKGGPGVLVTVLSEETINATSPLTTIDLNSHRYSVFHYAVCILFYTTIYTFCMCTRWIPQLLTPEQKQWPKCVNTGPNAFVHVMSAGRWLLRQTKIRLILMIRLRCNKTLNEYEKAKGHRKKRRAMKSVNKTMVISSMTVAGYTLIHIQWKPQSKRSTSSIFWSSLWRIT